MKSPEPGSFTKTLIPKEFESTGFSATFLLLAILLLVGIYFYCVDPPKAQLARPAKSTEGLLFGHFDPARATEIVVEGIHEKLRLKKSDQGTWAVLSPFSDVADGGKVQSFLEELKELKAEREVVRTEADLQSLGLDLPPFVIYVAGGQGCRLAIGGKTPSGKGRYVQRPGSPVQVVASSALAGLLVKPDDVRSKEIVGAFSWDRLRSIEITGAQTMKLSKLLGRWRVERPKAFEADPDVAEEVAEKLRWGKIKSFLPWSQAEAQRQLAEGLTVTLTAASSPEPVVVQLAEVNDAIVAATKGRNAVFVLGRDVFAALRKTPDELHRRKPVLAKTWSVEKLEIKSGNASATYEKAEGTWRRNGAWFMGEERESLTNFLQILEKEEAQRVIFGPAQDTSYGLDAPSAVIDLVDSQHGVQVFSVRKKGGRSYVRSGSEGPFYVMSAAYLDRALELLQASAAPPAPRTAKLGNSNSTATR